MSVLRLARACVIPAPARSTPLLLGRMGLASGKTLAKPIIHGPNLLSMRLASTQPAAGTQPSKPWTWRHAAVGVLGGTVLLGGYAVWEGRRWYEELKQKCGAAVHDLIEAREVCKELVSDDKVAERGLMALLGGQGGGGGEEEGKEDLLLARERLKACATAVDSAGKRHKDVLRLFTGSKPVITFGVIKSFKPEAAHRRDGFFTPDDFVPLDAPVVTEERLEAIAEAVGRAVGESARGGQQPAEEIEGDADRAKEVFKALFRQQVDSSEDYDAGDEEKDK